MGYVGLFVYKEGLQKKKKRSLETTIKIYSGHGRGDVDLYILKWLDVRYSWSTFEWKVVAQYVYSNKMDFNGCKSTYLNSNSCKTM